MALPGQYAIRLRQGITYSQEFQLLDSVGAAIDISTYTTRTCQVRTAPANQGGTVVCTGTVTATDAVNGKYSLTFTAATTAAISTAGAQADSDSLGPYDYEVKHSNGTVVIPGTAGPWTMDFSANTL